MVHMIVLFYNWYRQPQPPQPSLYSYITNLYFLLFSALINNGLVFHRNEMKFKAAVITVCQLIVILIVIVNIYMYYYGSTGKCKDQLKIYRTSHITQINDIVMEQFGAESVITRNKLSRQMNQMSKTIGQLQCEVCCMKTGRPSPLLPPSSPKIHLQN